MTAMADVREVEREMDGALLNGDCELTSEEHRAYMRFHRARNRANVARSVGVPVHGPIGRVRLLAFGSGRGAGRHETPARMYVQAFFDAVGGMLAARQRELGRGLVVLDLGCGKCPVADALEARGVVGHYIGLDLEPGRVEGGGGLVREVIAADAHEVDVESLPMVDAIVSATALEHLRDDGLVLRRLGTRLAAGGVQAHAVPGEGSLELYRAHGYRQYTPACLAGLLPGGRIHRYGGAWSNRVHFGAVTRPVIFEGRPALSQRRGVWYRVLRDGAMVVDRVVGGGEAVVYGVVKRTGARG